MSEFGIKPKHLIHVPQLDDEHGQLFAIADLLRKQLMEPDNLDTVRKTFAIFEKYMRIHFANEERIMLQCDYPGYHAHREIHRNLLTQMEAMGQQLVEGVATSAKFFNTSIAIWLGGHITSEDAKLGVYLQTRQKRVASRTPQQTAAAC